MTQNHGPYRKGISKEEDNENRLKYGGFERTLPGNKEEYK